MSQFLEQKVHKTVFFCLFLFLNSRRNRHAFEMLFVLLSYRDKNKTKQAKNPPEKKKEKKEKRKKKKRLLDSACAFVLYQ